MYFLLFFYNTSIGNCKAMTNLNSMTFNDKNEYKFEKYNQVTTNDGIVYTYEKCDYNYYLDSSPLTGQLYCIEVCSDINLSNYSVKKLLGVNIHICLVCNAGYGFNSDDICVAMTTTSLSRYCT